MFQQIVYDLLLRFGVQTSDIERDQFELFPVALLFREVSIDSRSVSIRQGVLSIISSASSRTSSTSVIFLVPLFLWCAFLATFTFGSVPQFFTVALVVLLLFFVVLLVGSTPTLAMTFFLGHSLVLCWLLFLLGVSSSPVVVMIFLWLLLDPHFLLCLLLSFLSLLFVLVLHWCLRVCRLSCWTV